VALKDKSVAEIVKEFKEMDLFAVGRLYEHLIPRDSTPAIRQLLTTAARITAFAVHTERQMMLHLFLKLDERLAQLEGKDGEN